VVTSCLFIGHDVELLIYTACQFIHPQCMFYAVRKTP
jgi:hypothetical protein